MNTTPRVWSFVLLFATMVCFMPNALSRNNCQDSCDSSCNRSCDRDCNKSCDRDCSFSCDRDCRKDCRSCSFDCDDDCAQSKTIFVPRNQTTDSTLELALTNYFLWHNTPYTCPEDKAFFNFQASYFHKESQDACDLAGYFLPNGKRCINVRENGTGDVNSLWVNLISAPGTQFNSTLCIAPRRVLDGGYFNFFFDFNSWLCGSWMAVSFAAMRAKHDLCIRERNVNQNLGTLNGIETARQAFNNTNWRAGRLASNTLENSGVDDVQLKFGWNYYHCNQDHEGIYIIGTAPTGDKRDECNKYLFAPFVGSRHGSIGVGLNTDHTAWNCGNHSLHVMTDLKYRYVLSACERRVFDLKCNGDFSRYLQVATNAQRSNSIPGVNVFTRDVEVTPGSDINFWAALHYNWCEFNLEFGWNLWWRDCDDICFKCPKQDLGYAIWDISGDCRRDPVSASNANITQTVVNAGSNVAPSDATFTPVRTSDLNKRSASHPRSLSNTIYGAFSYNCEWWCMPTLLGFVGSYEFGRCNTALDQWGIQLKAAVAF